MIAVAAAFQAQLVVVLEIIDCAVVGKSEHEHDADVEMRHVATHDAGCGAAFPKRQMQPALLNQVAIAEITNNNEGRRLIVGTIAARGRAAPLKWIVRIG